MRIVIAEENQTGRRMLAQVLRMEGHDVLLIEEDGDANELLNQYQPEMVLMNMFNASCGDGQFFGRSGVCEEIGLSPVVVMTSMKACEKMYTFMDRSENKGVDAFDHLPANAKIGTMDHVQRICEVLARSLRSTVRGGGERSAVQRSGQGLLDLHI